MAGFKLMDQDEGWQLLRERIDSRKWWVIVGEGGGQLIAERIDRTFYSGHNSRHFHALVIPMPGLMPLVVYLAAKSVMSREQFSETFGAPVGQGSDPEADIIWSADSCPEVVLEFLKVAGQYRGRDPEP